MPPRSWLVGCFSQCESLARCYAFLNEKMGCVLLGEMQAASIARPFRMRLNVLWLKVGCVAVARYLFFFIWGAVRSPIHKKNCVPHWWFFFFSEKIWNHKQTGEQNKVERTPTLSAILNLWNLLRIHHLDTFSSPKFVVNLVVIVVNLEKLLVEMANSLQVSPVGNNIHSRTTALYLAWQL